MAVARIVMQAWKDKFDIILKNSKIEELLSGLYVDDGRSFHRKLDFGERYDDVIEKFVVDEDSKKADIEAERSREEITRTEILRAMNSISKDLEFTMELCCDFGDMKLPTLSFALFAGKDGLESTYFEKSMRNQILVMERSAISRQQIMSIMSNELVRRLEVISVNLEQTEKDSIVNKYIQQLWNSEYNWKQCRDIVVSGLLGWKRKEARKLKLGIPRYRSGLVSLKERTEKRLLEKYNWFKKNKIKDQDDEKENLGDNTDNKKVYKKENKWGHYSKKRPPIEALEMENKDKIEAPPKAVLFVQYTVNSELATEIKKLVQTLRPWTNLNLKVVERGGHKLQDILCKSNPLDSTACDRVDCFTCNSSIKCEKQNFKSCYKRSIVYETWCYTCLKHHSNMSEHDEDQDNEVYVGAWLDFVEHDNK